MIDPITNIDEATGVYVEPSGTGLSWLWKLPDEVEENGQTVKHWMFWPSVWHDLQYDLRRCGMRSDETSYIVDNEFYSRLKEKAGTDTIRIAEAAIAHEIVNVVGKYRWPKKAESSAELDLYMSEGLKKLKMLREAGEM